MITSFIDDHTLYRFCFVLILPRSSVSTHQICASRPRALNIASLEAQPSALRYSKAERKQESSVLNLLNSHRCTWRNMKQHDATWCSFDISLFSSTCLTHTRSHIDVRLVLEQHKFKHHRVWKSGPTYNKYNIIQTTLQHEQRLQFHQALTCFRFYMVLLSVPRLFSSFFHHKRCKTLEAHSFGDGDC